MTLSVRTIGSVVSMRDQLAELCGAGTESVIFKP